MLEVTDKAVEMIKDFIKDRETPHSIRIMMSGGCGGPGLGMALDEAQDSDEVIENNGLTFVVDKILLEEAKPIQVDFIVTPDGSGFKLTSSPLTAAVAGCGGSCCGCS